MFYHVSSVDTKGLATVIESFIVEAPPRSFVKAIYGLGRYLRGVGDWGLLGGPGG